MNLDKFMVDGYQMIPGVFSLSEVLKVRKWLELEMTRALDELRHVLPRNHHPDLAQAIAELYENGGHNQVSADVRNIIAGQFPLSVRLDRPLKELLNAPRLRNVLEKIFPGEGLRAHFPPMARFVLPRNTLAGVPAHQDMSYNKHVSDFITGWVPLVAIDKECGGVRIHDKTKGLKEQLASMDRDLWLNPISDLGFPKIDYMMQPRDLLIFRKEIIHESLANRSDRVRFSIDYRFFGSNATTSKHYLDLQTGNVVEPIATAAA